MAWALIPPIIWFGLKTALVLAVFILLRAALPRPRFDQLMGWGWKILLPLALLNVFVTAGIVLLQERL